MLAVMNDCVFCKVIQGVLPAHKIWEDEHFLAILDINPNTPGHTLLLPKIHVPYVFDLEEALYSSLFVVAKTLSQPLLKVTKAKRIGVVVQGFTVPHVHVHLVPMNDVHDLDDARATPASKSELSSMSLKLRRVLSRNRNLEV
jgi:histidine triad (HIT) family protein